MPIPEVSSVAFHTRFCKGVKKTPPFSRNCFTESHFITLPFILSTPAQHPPPALKWVTKSSSASFYGVQRELMELYLLPSLAAITGFMNKVINSIQGAVNNRCFTDKIDPHQHAPPPICFLRDCFSPYKMSG